MSVRRLSVAGCVLALAVGVLALRRTLSAPPQVSFAAAARETLISSVSGNGKVEPLHFVTVRADRSGRVERVPVERGQSVAAGSVVAELDSREARLELAAAEARLEEARAALEVLRRGGRAAEIAELESALLKTRLELERVEREAQVLERLVAKQAAALQELESARARLAELRAEAQGLENKRRALVSAQDLAAAEARWKEAQAARDQAWERLQQCRIRSPVTGLLYELRVRRGDWLNPGEAVASIGRFDPLRVRIFVDEPELGRVARGLPVSVTWDARPGRVWQGRVEQAPLQVIALGTRQVGEVVLTIENPAQDLLPGANINAEIRIETVPEALVVPREAVRRENGRPGVFVLSNGEHVAWRPLRLGAASLTRVQVLEGLREGEKVALTTDRPLRDGLRVRALLP